MQNTKWVVLSPHDIVLAGYTWQPNGTDPNLDKFFGFIEHGHWTVGEIYGKLTGINGWSCWKLVPAGPRKLPLNEVFSKPLPLP